MASCSGLRLDCRTRENPTDRLKYRDYVALLLISKIAAPVISPAVTQTIDILVLEDGRALGTIRIEPGAIGTLTLTPDAAEPGAELAEQWKRITDAETVKQWLQYEHYYDVR